ncbi:MAG: NAD-dependent epimerase/dehydratase family protein [Bacteroidales bacterium]|nr:NAD-dependent epimerase/dehydratase family protein [Bacteroidales bacterium]
MKIAVTGTSGHIGNTLCRMLTDQGHEVKALVHNDKKALDGMKVEFIKGDVTSETDLSNLCSGCEIVFHLAAYISIRKNDPLCKKINFDGCATLIKAAKSTGVRKIIHFSSIHAFRHEPLDVELNETRKLAVDSSFSYDRSKALSQDLMMKASSKDLEIIVINPTAVLGPFDYKPSLTGNAIIRLYKGQIPALIPGGYDWVDVRDVCKAAIRSVDLGIPGECYLVGGSWQSVKTLACEIEKLGGHKTPWLELPTWVAQLGTPFLNLHAVIRKKEPLYTSVSLHALKNGNKNISHEKARLALDHNPRPFTETLSDTLAWFRENNYV